MRPATVSRRSSTAWRKAPPPVLLELSGSRTFSIGAREPDALLGEIVVFPHIPGEVRVCDALAEKNVAPAHPTRRRAGTRHFGREERRARAPHPLTCGNTTFCPAESSSSASCQPCGSFMSCALRGTFGARLPTPSRRLRNRWEQGPNYSSDPVGDLTILTSHLVLHQVQST